MIAKQTVFVLGAGASRPYGFPTGDEIANRILDELRHGHNTLLTELAQYDCDADRTGEFFAAFRNSGHFSLDAFIQHRTEFRDIAKILMASWLMRNEDEETLIGAPAEEDWYRALFAKMTMRKEADAVRGNQLAVVTFNFDRSFERRLFLALKATYNRPDEETADLARTIPVLHIHGQLGMPGWADASGRHYRRSKDLFDVRRCAGMIRLIDDEIDKSVLATANGYLERAETVCFIGFSFHPDNLDRLQGQSLANKTLHGTCKGMPQAEQERVYRYFNSTQRDYLRDLNARSFFDVVDVFS